MALILLPHNLRHEIRKAVRASDKTAHPFRAVPLSPLLSHLQRQFGCNFLNSVSAPRLLLVSDFRDRFLPPDQVWL